MRSARTKGFTLVEVIVAAGLSAIAVVACMGALGAIAKGQAKGRSFETLERMAYDKYRTVFSTFDLTQTSLSGDFTDEGINGYNWAASITATSTTNLSYMTVTVTDTADSTRKYSVTGLVFVPPATTTTTARAPVAIGGRTG